jgi:endonuclease/exonuclease/phosphatase family metal-dependent hydrolase
VVLTGVMGLTWGSPEAGRQPLRFMTYNIKAYRALENDRGFERLADELRRWDADVVVMQDAILEDGPLQQLPPQLHEALQRRQLFRHDQYVLASRWPVEGCRRGMLTPGEHQRGYLRCTLRVRGREIDVLTVHFLSPRDGLNATRRERLEGYDEWRDNWTVRMAQAVQLSEEVARQPRPLIVAGDLNAAEASPVVQRLIGQGLRDVWSSAERGWGYTYGHALKLRLDFLRIDHILVSPEIAVRAVQVGGKGASEHRPVIADLFLERDGADR